MEVIAGGGQQWDWALEANRSIRRGAGGRATGEDGARGRSCVLHGMWGWTSSQASWPYLQKRVGG